MDRNRPWDLPPRRLELPTGAVHAWRVTLDGPAVDASSLSAEERSRADRFRAVIDRSRFVASHAALRAILAHYAGHRPDELAFEVGPQGKPMLAGQIETGIEFNLSHSGSLAMVAVARGRRVGVDVEAVRPVAERESIVGRFYSARERSAFQALPEPLRLDAFFRVWTCKEAYIKAIGTGLLTPLESFSVGVDPRDPPRLVEIGGEHEPAERWSIRDLEPGEGYAAVVMAEGSDWDLSRWVYDPS